MKKINHRLRAAFGISKVEANGIMLLLPLMFILIASPYVFQYAMIGEPITLNHQEMDRLMLEMKAMIAEKETEKQSNSFKSKEKYKWNNKKGTSQRKDNKRFEYAERQYPKYTKPVITSFDINSADTSQLKNIYGIGPVLAGRIVKYRDLLGGFTSKDQLKEVYGLSDSVIVALDSLTFIQSEFNPSRLNINLLDEKSLKKHPYFTWKEVNAIINYRFQHGEFKTAEDLKRIHLLDSSKINKLLPYLTF